jgi:hypothetical protein
VLLHHIHHIGAEAPHLLPPGIHSTLFEDMDRSDSVSLLLKVHKPVPKSHTHQLVVHVIYLVTASLVSLSQTSTNFLLLIVPVSETKGPAMLQKASTFFITSLRDQVFLKMRKI